MDRSTKPFGEALADALRAEQNLPLGRISLRAFFQRVNGWSYDGLRKMANGELAVNVEAVVICAAELHLPPEYFLEYRQAKAERLVHDELAAGRIDLEDIQLIIDRHDLMDDPPRRESP